MSNVKYPAIIFFIIVIMAMSLPSFYYSHLPDKVAIHFNINGDADNWSSKTFFIIIQLSLILFLTAVFGGLSIFAGKIPKSLINLPNKNHWLNDQNKYETITLTQRFLLWIGSITTGFTTFVFMETYKANISGNEKIGNNFWFYLAGYLGLTAIFTINFLMHFRKQNEHDTQK